MAKFNELKPGTVFYWRGHRATVEYTWDTFANSPLRHVPIGLEFSWTDENNQHNKTRLYWPDMQFTPDPSSGVTEVFTDFTPDEILQRAREEVLLEDFTIV